MYKQREVRGIVKYNEEKEKRITVESGRNKDNLWREITETGTVFTHSGFNEDFETFERYNLPNRQRKDRNEVVLAKSHMRSLFVEFTPKDLSAITLSTATPKYVRKEGHTIYGPNWTLDE